MSLVLAFYDILENPTILGGCTGMILFLGPIWVAFLVGVVVGWVWKPKWASLGIGELSCSLVKSLEWCSLSPSPSKQVCSSLSGSELQSPNPQSLVVENGLNKRPFSSPPPEYDSCSGYLPLRLLSIILIISSKLTTTYLVLVCLSFYSAYHLCF